MSGNRKEVASSAQLDGHLRANPKDAHGIWEQAKAYVDARDVSYIETTIDLTSAVSTAGSWTDYDFGAALPSSVFRIRYYVRLTSGTPREVNFQMRRKGATIPQSGQAFASYDVDTTNQNRLSAWEWGDEQNVIVDVDGHIHVEYYKSCDGATIEVKVVGYWKKGA